MEEGKKVERPAIGRHIDAVLQTESGREFVAWLHDACGFNVTSLVRQPDGEIAPLSTECKEAQRLVYLNIRKLATRELIVKAEDLAHDKHVVAAKKIEEERKK